MNIYFAYTKIKEQGGEIVPKTVQTLLNEYMDQLKSIYGHHLKTVILYGSYARGDFTKESDIDLMILLDMDDLDIKEFRHSLSDITYDFNTDYELDIRPIAKSIDHYRKWVDAYPFYANIEKEGVKLFDAA